MGQLGGKRKGAGRPKGTKNLRTIAATELVGEAQKQFPGYNPIAALIALAESAGDDATLAKECHAAVLPYMTPKFRPIEADPDALVALETRLAEVRSKAVVRELDGLAERLERADKRVADHRSLPAAVTYEEAAPVRARPAPLPKPEPDPEPVREAAALGPKPVADREPYRPVTPWPEPKQFSGLMDPNYRPFED